MKSISDFLKEENLSLDNDDNSSQKNTPLIICGDFNSESSSSFFHILNDKKYLLTEGTGRTDPSKGVKAYKKQEGIDIFNQVHADYEANRESMSNVIGKVKSSYTFFNDDPKYEKWF